MPRVLVTVLCLSLSAYAQAPAPTTAGDQFFVQGQYAQAAAAFERLAVADRTPRVLNRLAISYLRLNRNREAERAYRRAIRIAPDEAMAYNNLGALYYSQRRFGDADTWFRRAAQRDPSNNVIRRNMHAARWGRENPRIARNVSTELVKTEPHLIQEISNDFVGVLVLLTDSVKTAVIDHTNRGDAFMAQKAYEDAAGEYRKALALDRYDTYVTNRLGIAYLQMKKYYEAELQYRETLRLDPYFPEALNNLGFIEYSKANFPAAIDLYSQALAIQPRSATVYMNIAASYFSMRDYDQGAKAVEDALAIDAKLLQRGTGNGTLVQGSQPNDPMMQFRLAKRLAARGDADTAMSYLYKAVDAGFKDVNAIRNESAFATLAKDQRFNELLDRARRP